MSQVKADIVPYTTEYARDVRSWIECEETLYNLCRGKDFPPPPDVVESWQRKDVTPYLLFSESQPVAYAELWERRLEREIEITHLLVDPFRRERGFGTKMLNLLFDRAAQRPGVAKVVLHLLTDNAEALGCYLSAGFELVGTMPGLPGLRMVRMAK
ncbi:MAG: GNAT family N-acetyltransferase [candidate division Zixibacteria bacterium]|nr:GNAT family N-acetyltransferase [candidate division Zixibacteria bacterium]